TLERLLASTQDNEIELWFDERELARAFDEDEVEGHGFRQRAAVLAVAVAAAGASAGPSLAMVDAGSGVAGGGSGGQSIGYNVNPQATYQGAAGQPAGAERGLLQDENIVVQDSGGAGASSVTTSGDSALSTGELAAIAAGGALLISAAGFGVARKRERPVQPA